MKSVLLSQLQPHVTQPGQGLRGNISLVLSPEQQAELLSLRGQPGKGLLIRGRVRDSLDGGVAKKGDDVTVLVKMGGEAMDSKEALKRLTQGMNPSAPHINLGLIVVEGIEKDDKGQLVARWALKAQKVERTHVSELYIKAGGKKYSLSSLAALGHEAREKKIAEFKEGISRYEKALESGDKEQIKANRVVAYHQTLDIERQIKDIKNIDEALESTPDAIVRFHLSHIDQQPSESTFIVTALEGRMRLSPEQFAQIESCDALVVDAIPTDAIFYATPTKSLATYLTSSTLRKVINEFLETASDEKRLENASRAHPAGTYKEALPRFSVAFDEKTGEERTVGLIGVTMAYLFEDPKTGFGLSPVPKAEKEMHRGAMPEDDQDPSYDDEVFFNPSLFEGEPGDEYENTGQPDPDGVFDTAPSPDGADDFHSLFAGPGSR